MHPDHKSPISRTAVAAAVFTAVMLVSLALVRFVAAHAWEAFHEDAARLAALKAALAGSQGLDAEKKRLYLQQDSLTGRFQTLSRQFGGTKDLPGALRMLIEKANAADIRFVKMQPSSQGSPDKDGRYPIVLEMTASYHSLGRFVSSLEEVPHLVRLDRFAITANRGGMLDIRIQLTCTLFGNG
jgi:type IV pilus assembly protein PilO